MSVQRSDIRRCNSSGSTLNKPDIAQSVPSGSMQMDNAVDEGTLDWGSTNMGPSSVPHNPKVMAIAHMAQHGRSMSTETISKTRISKKQQQHPEAQSHHKAHRRNKSLADRFSTFMDPKRAGRSNSVSISTDDLEAAMGGSGKSTLYRQDFGVTRPRSLSGSGSQQNNMNVNTPRANVSPNPFKRGSKKRSGSGASTDWTELHATILIMFQREQVVFDDLHAIHSMITDLLEERGPGMLFAQFKLTMAKGMMIMRGPMRDMEGEACVNCLTELWEKFYGKIMPALSIMFAPCDQFLSARGPINDLCLLAFRDHCLLYRTVVQALQANVSLIRVPSSKLQMLLLIQGVAVMDDNEQEVQQILNEVVPFIPPSRPTKERDWLDSQEGNVHGGGGR